MNGAARLLDLCTGHPHPADGGRFPSRINITASDDVFVNDRGAHRVGDLWDKHKCTVNPSHIHDGIQIQGSSTVFVNDRPKARIGDQISCGSQVMTGSSDVIVGD